MDITQVLLVFVVVTLTILLVLIGIQVFNILAEIRKSLAKVNKMLEDAGTVTGNVSKTISGATGMVDGLKAGLSLVSVFGKKKDKE
ncbi:hypothetical protein C4579_00445 [Candidatus Microgenomates bacterium]|nr:MAG: hypothetical protein C4579_00445 [Candidatus Microgenomates bacterium]